MIIDLYFSFLLFLLFIQYNLVLFKILINIIIIFLFLIDIFFLLLRMLIILLIKLIVYLQILNNNQILMLISLK